MMTAASLPNSGVTSSNGGVTLLVSVALTIAVGIAIQWYFFGRKQESLSVIHESPQEHSERMAALREKRLRILQEDKRDNGEGDKMVSKYNPEKSDIKKNQEEPLSQTPSDVSNGNDCIQGAAVRDVPRDQPQPYFIEVQQSRKKGEKVQEPVNQSASSPQSMENESSSVKTSLVTNTEILALETEESQKQTLSDEQKTQESPMNGQKVQEPVTESMPCPCPSKNVTPSNKSTVAKTSIVSLTSTADESQQPESPLKQDKKKKHKRSLPPPQLLCEALAQVFRCKVVVESNADAGTWGGEGWKNRPSDYPNATTITLSLHSYRPESLENEWEALAFIFPKLLDKHLRASLFPKQDVKHAATCHARAKNMARNGFSLLVTRDDGFEEFKSCVETLGMWLARQVVEWIRPQVETAKRNLADDDFDDVDDLFSDEYCGDSVSSCASTGDTGPMDMLFLLLQDSAAPVITANFLEDLFCAYETATKDDHLSQIFLCHALKRLAIEKQSSSFSSAALTHRVSALSSLLSAPSVCQSLSTLMQQEVSQMKDKNGHEIQQLVRLAPLFQAAAYTIPAAGAERTRTGPFFQQMARVQDFPLSAYRVKARDEVGRIMEDARRTMNTAQGAAEASLRVAFKTGGKKQTFQWLTNIIRSK